MNKPIKTIAVALAAIASMSVQQTEACTRATYIGPDNTGHYRTYDGLERRPYE